jgi:hypothetical protein
MGKHIDRFIFGLIVATVGFWVIFGIVLYINLVYFYPIYALGLLIIPICYFIGWLSEKFGIL